MKKLYTVTDLGPGDGGKGGVVHKLSHMRRAHTILKVGGAQGSHGVQTFVGDRFAFSQFGCGTFEGVRTHLTHRFIATPHGILNEAEALRCEHGIHDVFDLLTVDEDVICATPYHGIASRLKELVRGNNPRGTVGTGVGEAYRFHERCPHLTIHARDLLRPDMRDRIAAIRRVFSRELEPITVSNFSVEDRHHAQHEIDCLESADFFDDVVRRFKEVAQQIKIVDRDYLLRILRRDGIVVVESSHGVLTDRYQGFHPHTSAIRTLPRFTRAMLEEAGYDGEIINIAVTRAYGIRHGAGPMPTADEAMAERLLPGSHKDENRFQGRVRVGPLDLVLLRYAIASCGGPNAFDGLAITWFDQIKQNGLWVACDRYRNADDPTYFTPSGELRVRFGDDMKQLACQEQLGTQLQGCVPELIRYDISSDATNDQLYKLCAGVLQEKLDIPVRMVSFGPTERDKLCK